MCKVLRIESVTISVFNLNRDGSIELAILIIQWVTGSEQTVQTGCVAPESSTGAAIAVAATRARAMKVHFLRYVIVVVE